MKKPCCRVRALIVCAQLLGCMMIGSASASSLDRISWVEDAAGDVLTLTLDDHPGYVISESRGGNVIELTLEDTMLGPDIGQIEPAGLVRSSVVLTEENDIKIQFLLTSAGRATVTPVDGGFRVAIRPVEEDATPAASSLTHDEVSAVQTGKGVLTGIRYSRVSGDRVQIDLAMDGDAGAPAVFKTVHPPRIAFDFFGISNQSSRMAYQVSIAAVDSVIIAQDDQRMRVVLNLTNPADYSLARNDDGYVVTVGSAAAKVGASIPVAESQTLTQAFDQSANASGHSIESVDFRRTPNGGGRIIVRLSDSEVAVNLRELGAEIVAVFTDTDVPGDLEQRLDVIDFATPVSYIDVYDDGRHAKMVVTVDDRFKQSSVQSGDTLVLDISPFTEAEIAEEQTDEFGYKGEKLSLNFQRISVRAALQVIADFTGLNFVTSDAISGNLSLRLKDVPWDQALDVILQTKGLAMRQRGNVIWVAPAEEITAKEKQSLAARQETQELEPLVSELIRVSYAKVEDMAKILKSVKAVETDFTQSAFGSVSVNEIKTEENSLLSSRGSVTVDQRTNSLLIQDTASKLVEIKRVIAKLDIPVRQVQIETRIVEANDDFSKNIGARLGFTQVTQQARIGNTDIGSVFSSGTIENTNRVRTEGLTEVNDDALSVNLPANAIGTDPAANYAFTIAKLGSGFLSLLDLEISALQAEGNGRILANPKILTTDKRSASIEQGQERVTTFGSAFGTAATEGQRAVLSLTVLPQITPDDRVILDVDITNDSFVAANTNTVNTKRINTQALLENGETVVIGGIYTQDETFSVSKVPFLGDLPLIGALFRKRTARNNRSELLVFLTPRIIDPALAVQ